MKLEIVDLQTIQCNGVRVSQLFRRNIDLLIGDWREEWHHVELFVVTNRGHLIWEAGVRWNRPSHPLIKNGISKSMEHLQFKERSIHNILFTKKACQLLTVYQVF